MARSLPAPLGNGITHRRLIDRIAALFREKSFASGNEQRPTHNGWTISFFYARAPLFSFVGLYRSLPLTDGSLTRSLGLPMTFELLENGDCNDYSEVVVRRVSK